jgi:hypothetical protein
LEENEEDEGENGKLAGGVYAIVQAVKGRNAPRDE